MLPVAVTSQRRARRLRNSLFKASVDLSVGGKQSPLDLGSGQPHCLLPMGGGETKIAIRLRGQVVSHVGTSDAPVCLFFEIQSPDDVKPQWLQSEEDSAGHHETSEHCDDPAWDVPPRFNLDWFYSTDGREEKKALQVIDDGTGGLRRSGVVRLASADEETFEILTITIRSATTDQTLPRVLRIVPNCVLAEHRVHRTFATHPAVDAVHQNILRWAQCRQPGNDLKLPLDVGELPIPESVQLWLMERTYQRAGNDWTTVACWSDSTWQHVFDFSLSGPEDRHLVVDRARQRLDLGDGLNGRLPVPLEGPARQCLFYDEPALASDSFQLEYGGLTASVAHTASADHVQNALSTLGFIADCSGGPLPTQPIAIEAKDDSASLLKVIEDSSSVLPRITGDLFDLSLDVGGGSAGNVAPNARWQTSRIQLISRTSRKNFQLSFGNETTGNISAGATADNIQEALLQLSSVPEGGVVCSGGPLDQEGVVVVFSDSFLSQRLVPRLVARGDEAPAITVPETSNLVASTGGREAETVVQAATARRQAAAPAAACGHRSRYRRARRNDTPSINRAGPCSGRPPPRLSLHPGAGFRDCVHCPGAAKVARVVLGIFVR